MLLKMLERQLNDFDKAFATWNPLVAHQLMKTSMVAGEPTVHTKRKGGTA